MSVTKVDLLMIAASEIHGICRTNNKDCFHCPLAECRNMPDDDGKGWHWETSCPYIGNKPSEWHSEIVS